MTCFDVSQTSFDVFVTIFKLQSGVCRKIALSFLRSLDLCFASFIHLASSHGAFFLFFFASYFPLPRSTFNNYLVTVQCLYHTVSILSFFLQYVIHAKYYCTIVVQ